MRLQLRVARQDHYSNGSVLLSFDAYMMVPTAGESGTLSVSVQDGSGPWTGSMNVSFPVTGENNATMQVRSVCLDACCFPETLLSGIVQNWTASYMQTGVACVFRERLPVSLWQSLRREKSWDLRNQRFSHSGHAGHGPRSTGSWQDGWQPLWLSSAC